MAHDHKIEAGTRIGAAFGSEARGAFVSAAALFSSASGYAAQTLSSDSYAIVWNGDNSRIISDIYMSHGPGTINLNPANGLSGIYIGERQLSQIISDEIQKEIKAGITTCTKQFMAQIVQIKLALVQLQNALHEIRREIDQIKNAIPQKLSQLVNDTRFVTSWSIGNGKLKLARNGVIMAEFSANQAKDLSVDLG